MIIAPQTNNQRHQEGDDLSIFHQLLTFVGQDLEKVNHLILERMQSSVHLIPELADHIINAGGKRIRPLLTLLSAALCDYKGELHIKLAACIEFMHTATLLHDDVIDESKLRRGRPSANNVWGNKASILVGDFLFAQGFELMVETQSLPVLNVLSKASTRIVEGEVLQLCSLRNIDTSLDTYFKVIEAKTAKLFGAACEVSGLISPTIQEHHVHALRQYGHALGIVFQIIDDFLDYAAAGTKFGKVLGNDFREGKMTLPVIYAYPASNEKEKDFWRRTLQKREQEQGDFTKAQELIHSTGAGTQCHKTAQQYAQKAYEALNVFPDSALKLLLKDLVDFCLNRAY